MKDKKSGPGQSQRSGITLMQLADMFPDEAAATEWFEGLVWPGGARSCPHCGGCDTRTAAKTSGLPYWCPDCKRAFSVRIGTALERSKVPLRSRASETARQGPPQRRRVCARHGPHQRD